MSAELLRFEQKLDDIQAVVLKLPMQLQHLEYRINEQAKTNIEFTEFKNEVKTQLNTMRGIGLTIGALFAIVNVVPALISIYSKIAGQ